MANGFLEWVAGVDEEHGKRKRLGAGYSIAPGKVVDNLNLLAEGRVQVHIPSLPAFDPWARIAAVGGGPGRGFAWVPQVDDEVLVAFSQNDERDAYILGGLWSMANRPPISDPISFLNKRVIKTGMKNSPLAQTIELDDLTQSVSITTSLGHSITLDKDSVELSALKGILKISMKLGTTPSISIQAVPGGNIELSAPTGTITLQANQVDITSTTATNIKSAAMVTVRGPQVQLN
jgi:uncharacterized protein involved in type VI secretion and phage assembly